MAIADEWFNKKMLGMAEALQKRVYSQLTRDIYPHLGSKKITLISPQELLMIIQGIEERGAIETAHRTLRTCSKVFQYAVVTGRASSDITSPLKSALRPIKCWQAHPLEGRDEAENGHFEQKTLSRGYLVF